jgi:hypothetical protein
MTSTTANKTAKNTPAVEVFFVEERHLDDTVLAIMGRPKEKSLEKQWHKVGVGFKTKTDNLTILIGDKGSPTQKKALISFTDGLQKMQAHPEGRLPVANVYLADGNGDLDFEKKDGVAFLNSDDSLSVIIGDKGDPAQLRYVIREIDRRR